MAPMTSSYLILTLLGLMMTCSSGYNLRSKGRELLGGNSSLCMPLQFDKFCTEKFCAFRCMAKLGGLNVLVDSGSSSLAFCMALNSSLVENVTPALDFDGKQQSQCTLYGGNGGIAHGWTGPSYYGDIHSPHQVLPGVLFSVMEHAVGINGNACGIPAADSAGIHQPLGGIWGIAGSTLNGVGTMTETLKNTWTNLTSSGSCNLNKGECSCPRKTFSSPDSLIASIHRVAEHSQAEQWGIAWDGELGEETGKLYFGKDADLPTESPYSQIFLPTLFEPYYGIKIQGTSVHGTKVPRKPFPAIFDSGTPFFVLPQRIIQAAESALATSLETDITLTFETSDGKAVDLKMRVTESILSTDFVGSDDTPVAIIGLPVMRYLEYIKVNFALKHLQFLPRENPVLNLNLN